MINSERCAEGTVPVGRPLTRAVAIPKYAKKWWAGTGLNRRHQDFQSCALPTELPAHQTREDSRRAWGRPLPVPRERLLDGRDHAEGAGLLEEERDDDDLAGLELARQLEELDPLAAGMQAREARRGHRDPGERLTGLGQELGALGDRRLDAHERVLEHPRAVDVHEEQRAGAVSHDAPVLGQEAHAADVLDGWVVNTAAREQTTDEQEEKPRSRRPSAGAASASWRHAPLNAPSATIAPKARS